MIGWLKDLVRAARWRRDVRRLLEEAGCRDVSFVDEAYQSSFGRQLGVEARYGMQVYRVSFFYNPGDRETIDAARRFVLRSCTTFGSPDQPDIYPGLSRGARRR